MLQFKINWVSVKYEQVNDTQYKIKIIKKGSKEGITTIENYLQIETEMGKANKHALLCRKS